MSEMKIYTVTHKELPLIDNRLFQPIQVGRALTGNIITNIIGDDTGNNISKKNANYCELTALYWIWKNDIDSQIIGLNHYRRYFNFIDNNGFWGFNHLKKISKGDSKYSLDNICSELHENKIINYLSNYDIIVPKKKLCRINRYTPVSIGNEYIYAHIYEDYAIMLSVLKEAFGSRFNYESFFKFNFFIVHYNMLICKRNVFFDYCSWLFPLLEKIESRVKISDYKGQARVFGYISERLFSLYLVEKSFKIKYKEVLFIEDI